MLLRGDDLGRAPPPLPPVGGVRVGVGIRVGWKVVLLNKMYLTVATFCLTYLVRVRVRVRVTADTAYR